jgi:hypothetical protein
MNYTIYLNGEKRQETFNYIEKVGDLQSIILEKLKLKRRNVLCILHDSLVLGTDYLFESSILEHNLFEVTLHIVIDPEDQSVGTKTLYHDWLKEVQKPDQLIEAHRQIMYDNILNDNWSSTAVNFMTVPAPVSAPVAPMRRSSRSRTTRTTSNTTPRTTSSSVRTSISPLNTNINTTSSGRSTNVSTSQFAPTTRTQTFSSSNTTNNQMNQQIQDLFTTFMGMNPTSTTSNPSSSLLNSIFALGDVDEISVSTTTIPLNQDFWGMLNNLESVPVTLSQESINTLPTFIYDEIPDDIKRVDENGKDTCTICMQDYEGSDDIRVLLCKHYYHKACVDRWLSQENTRCPVCRHDSRDAPRSSEGD